MKSVVIVAAGHRTRNGCTRVKSILIGTVTTTNVGYIMSDGKRIVSAPPCETFDFLIINHIRAASNCAVVIRSRRPNIGSCIAKTNDRIGAVTAPQTTCSEGYSSGIDIEDVVAISTINGGRCV